MKQLIENVVQWGRDRGLDKVGHLAQAKYTLKETAELLDAYADGDQDKMNDAIGDILVTLIVGASNDDDLLRDLTLHIIENDFNKWCDSIDFLENYTDLIDSIQWFYFKIMNNDFDMQHYLVVVSSLNSFIENIAGFPSIKDCLQLAYDEIKNRTGKMVNGQFIKD